MRTIYQRATAAGIPMDHHESDLYLKDTPEARRILAEWRAESGRDEFVTYFHDQETGEQWIDIAFAYDPFWVAKGERSAIMDARGPSERKAE